MKKPASRERRKKRIPLEIVRRLTMCPKRMQAALERRTRAK
jgi:hypothetical protein